MSSHKTSISINHLDTLLSGVILAQKRGAYSFEESGLLAEPVKIISLFLNNNDDNKEKQKIEQQPTNVKIPSNIQEENLTLKNLI
jgi:hypothetical protein